MDVLHYEYLKCGRIAQFAFQLDSLPQKHHQHQLQYRQLRQTHAQFHDRRMTPSEVIDYIADHNSSKATDTKK